jgi:hypothetical protein
MENNLGLLTTGQLEAIRSRYLLATPGVWLWTEITSDDGTPFLEILGAVQSGHISNLKTIAVLGGDRIQDADFITQARNDVYALLMEVQYLRELLSAVTPKVIKPEEFS